MTKIFMKAYLTEQDPQGDQEQGGKGMVYKDTRKTGPEERRMLETKRSGVPAWVQFAIVVKQE